MKSGIGRVIVSAATFAASVALFMATLPFTSRVRSDKGLESDSYADTIRKTYNFRFGKDNISLPGNAAIEGNQFIQPGAFPEAEYCGHCHDEAYHQWRQALHSNSFRTPFYRTSVNILVRTKGIEFSRHCDSCHNPIVVLSGGLTQDSHVDRAFDRDGLTCTTCHSIQRLQSTSGNDEQRQTMRTSRADWHHKRVFGQMPSVPYRGRSYTGRYSGIPG